MRRSYLQAVVPVLISVVVFLTISVAAVGQTAPYMVKQINTGADTASSSPSKFVQAGSLTFFVASDSMHGQELWATDGTESGTRLVKDIYPGASSSSPQYLTNMNGMLFFQADDGVHGAELWKSDGTAAGTVMVKDISVPAGSIPAYLTVMNGTLYFRASDMVYGPQLWKSDGTAAGTVKVGYVPPQGSAEYPANLTNVSGMLFFNVKSQLWRSDGTDAGTMMLKDLPTNIYPPSALFPANLTNMDGTLFFTATDDVHGNELWKSDGTAAGTVMVKDIYPGVESSSPGSMTYLNGMLFFSAYDGTSDGGLYMSDGTPEGTVPVKPGSNPGAGYLTNVNGTLFFSYGSELWKSDGTAAGTVMVKDIDPVYQWSTYSLTNVNGTLFFTTHRWGMLEQWDTVLWKSDGTAAGTVVVKNIYPTPHNTAWPNLQYMANGNGTLFFQADDGVHGYELWKSDGTDAGTVMVKNIATNYQANIANPVDINGTLFYSATDGVNGAELWKSDGTVAGTVMVKDICPGSCNSSPQSLININGTLFFTATDGVNGIELWKSDGTAAGTVMVKDIYPGANNSGAASLTNVNGTLLFTATDGVNGIEVWKSDGTTAGTVMVKDIYPGASGSAPSYLTNVNGTLFFKATDGVNGSELWKSDGTAAGTVMVKDIYPGLGGSAPAYLTNVNGTLFFQARDNVSGYELWKSDGTAAGTVMVKDIYPGASSSNPSLLTNVNGTLFFQAYDGVNGNELWKSDGTPEGTVLVKDVNPGAKDSNLSNLTNVNGTLAFQASDGATGAELWKSDGTTAGTVLVKDICTGICNSVPQSLVNVNGTLFFTATDGVNGVELWKSDGTAAGTSMVADIALGSASSSPALLTVSGQHLFFSADDGTGSQLWALDIQHQLIASMSTPASGSTLSDSSVTFNWNPASGASLYWIWIGTTPGGMELYNQGQGTNTSASITGLPANGLTVYVRLFTLMNGAWLFNDYTYKAATLLPAAISTPAPGTTLTGASVTFDWNAASGATQYWMWIGTTPGGMELYNQGQALNTSATVSGLPTDGSSVYVRLFSVLNGAWQWNDYTYTTATVLSKAVMSSPANGATLTGSTVNFQWSAGAGATQYWMWIGTTPGGMELYNQGQALNTSVTVNGLPTDGSAVYVRLFSVINGAWEWNDYSYTAATLVSKAAMTSPANGATLTGSSVMFTWSAAPSATQYWMWIGTTPGGMELYNQGQALNTSATVSSLPVDGSNVYVRLFSVLNGAWQWNDYTYTAFTSKAVMTSPTNGSTLSGTSVTFQWSQAAGAAQYWMWVGKTPGGMEWYNQGLGLNNQVNVYLPGDGSAVYVRLFTYVNGQWQWNDYSYTNPVVATVTSYTISTTTSSMTVNWTTSEPARSKVNWGVGSDTSQVIPEDSDYVTNHSITINGLTSATYYSVIVSGHNQDGYSYTSTKKTVRTP